MIHRIAIVGAGQMGSGIAHVAALSGLDVDLLDVSNEILERAVRAIRRNMERQVARASVAAGAVEPALARIRHGTDFAVAGDADLVIEAATENADVKRSIFSKVDPLLRPHALLATNTSSISITLLAASTDRPDKFMGMHLMNLVPMMKLVELIRGIATDDDTCHTTHDLAVQLNKTPVDAGDFPGFTVNRILLPMINEAVYALHEGEASVEGIGCVSRSAGLPWLG